jgi:hypothetical protein
MWAGATPKTFWAAEGRKSGVAPAQSGVFFCVTFLILVSFISSFSRDLCASQGEEDGEDEVEAGNSYLPHLLRPNSHRAHRKNFLLGWSDRHGARGNTVGSLQPTPVFCPCPKSTAAGNATSMLRTMSAHRRGERNGEPQREPCLSCTVHFSAPEKAFESHSDLRPSTTTEASETQNVRNKLRPPPERPPVPSFLISFVNHCWSLQPPSSIEAASKRFPRISLRNGSTRPTGDNVNSPPYTQRPSRKENLNENLSDLPFFFGGLPTRRLPQALV